jgi:hypothetical protein
MPRSLSYTRLNYHKEPNSRVYKALDSRHEMILERDACSFPCFVTDCNILHDEAITELPSITSKHSLYCSSNTGASTVTELPS